MRQELKADVIIIGGGVGGTAAALAAAEAGMRVILTEETDWIGGQLTAQAVPPDEHRWIERDMGATAAYLSFRNRVRSYYRDNYPLAEQAKNDPLLNPGQGWVSRLCHEPRVALRVLEDMLAPFVNSGRVDIRLGCAPVEARTEGDRVVSVTVRRIRGDGGLRGSEEYTLKGAYYLDATELGDLLPLTGTEFVSGAEARGDTNEPHAPEQADPLDMQAITHVAALDYAEGGTFTIPKPEQYDFWKSYRPFYSPYPMLSWETVNPEDVTKTKRFTLFPNDRGIVSLWDYRRIVEPRQLDKPLYDGPVSLLNWPQNDYFLGPIIGVPERERSERLEAARQLTLSLVYWLQTEAPRLDGGTGYPGLRLRGDMLGTSDGLAKSPYIRESRRIRPVYRITEADVSAECRGRLGIRRYEDSVGVGSYALDVHVTTVSRRGYYIPSLPYEIPLGALLPIRMTNLLPACKNIGTTQVTNSCYRLHPTEWNIGEAAGSLAAYAIRHGVLPRDVRCDAPHLKRFQQQLAGRGVQLHWPEEAEAEAMLGLV
ncbi:FAD-dependent oxidoreductase [Cohnella lubricantis]|uniref:FAD-dependent oxidoreductase n=1 Tax=Cohnella lubricantis TaxID=2163172 RepID=A0A841TGX4_9BACL|nr:FAD-dependent oxidoreductase [Cohnella lubricantis]MBB6678490.1 FAD-dependent oxidoreductase [Cohnella lubricantis]MBP2118413.1 hypothetical protein [Cohnella lubricantis]